MNRLKRSLINDFWIILFDIVAFNLSYYLALLIRFYINNEFRPSVVHYIPSFYHFAPIYTVASLVIFFSFRLYGNVWRYAGVHDMNRIAVANAVISLFHVVGTILLTERMPVTYYFIGAGFQFILTTITRFGNRIILEEKARLSRRSKSLKNAMIVGVGETGRVVKRQIDADPKQTTKVVCIFSYKESDVGSSFDGVPVLGNLDDFALHLKKYRLDKVILADSMMPIEIRKRIKQISQEYDVEVQDYSGYLRNDSTVLSFTQLVEYTSGEITIESDENIKDYENGQQALGDLVGRHDVKSISVRNSKLFIELVSYKVSPLVLFYITNRPDVALVAERYGVDRIWIDLETIGKEKRQRGLNTVKSDHKISDIVAIKPLLTKAELMVRINSWYEGSRKEIDEVIKAGADIIMLPYWKTVEEVDDFLKAVNGRCKTTLLLETKEAVECIDEVLTRNFDEIHIGLNDLSLSYGLTFIFELLPNGTVEMLCNKFKQKGIPYGFGGIAKLGSGLLPAEKIIMEHYRLGSTRAILSRSFCDCSKISNIDEIEQVFAENMEKLRDYEFSMGDVTRTEFMKNKAEIGNAVEEILEQFHRS